MSEELPAGWEKRVSRSNGQAYYLNVYTKESQWDTPTKEAEPASSSGPNKVSFDYSVIFKRTIKKIIITGPIQSSFGKTQ